jgi:hypothetical protein
MGKASEEAAEKMTTGTTKKRQGIRTAEMKETQCQRRLEIEVQKVRDLEIALKSKLIEKKLVPSCCASSSNRVRAIN